MGAGKGGCVRPITATEKTHALASTRATWPWSRRRLGDGRREAGSASTSPPLSLLDLFIVVFDAKAKLVPRAVTFVSRTRT
jgi:hypothetical protein